MFAYEESAMGRPAGWFAARRFFRIVAACAIALVIVSPVRAGEECNDGDGDGYGSPGNAACPAGTAADCRDDLAAVNPGADEICGDGLDNDCDGDTDAADSDLVLVPDDVNAIYGFESRGICQGTADACDLRTPESNPENCNCIGNTNNFSQVIQACVDGGVVTGPCDNGDPNEEGSLAVGDACEGGGTCQPIPVAIGEPCTAGTGLCRALGTVICDNGVVVCDASPSSPPVAVEGDPDPSADVCFDLLDNDCDGLVDQEDPECQTAELCDGVDNDNNGMIDEGFDLGADCTVGLVGSPCENTGVLICNASGGVKCNVNANPKPEFKELSCGDGIDNDCDGDIDCADANCSEPVEVCDGVDNNCDGEIDEGFVGLGDLCVVGQGACAGVGTIICNADQTGTRCSASMGSGSPERLTAGDSCTDGIDNDCDGKTDDEEADCVDSTLSVACSLIYDGPPSKRFNDSTRNGRGERGADCTGWHVPEWVVTGAAGEVTCSAVLKGLEPDGTVIDSLSVRQEERLHLASRIDRDDYKMNTKTKRGGQETWHEAFVPVPLLEVTCVDEQGTAKAYCSNVPYLDVIQPNGGVVSGSAGDEIQVSVAIPRIDPTKIQVLIDCIDIIPQLVGDPATELPGGPFSGTVDVNGTMMMIKDLVIDTPDPDTESSVEGTASNTLSMTVLGAGCGGHAIFVQGEHAPDFPLDPPGQISSACHVDDGTDIGEWSVFTIDVTNPMENEIIVDGVLRPTSVNVTGEVCAGEEIEAVVINGWEATLPDPTIVGGGDMACAGDTKTVTVSFNEDIPITDLAAVFAGTQITRGSFDPGPNLLVAQGRDVLGNTTFDELAFVVGPAILNPLTEAIQSSVASAADGTISKAFTLIIDDTVTLDNGNRALRELFDNFSREFARNLADCLAQPREVCCEKELDMPWWTCNPDVDFCVTPSIPDPAAFAETFNISVTPSDGVLTVRLVIPEYAFNVTADGNCCTGGCGFFCVARTKVDFNGTFTVPNLAVEIDIEESDIMNQDGTFTLRFIPGDDSNISIEGNTESAIKTGCGLLSVGTLIDVLTLGISALPRVFFNVAATIGGFVAEQKGIDLCPFVREIGGGDGMQDQSDDANVCRDDLDMDFSASLENNVEAVEITPQGLAIAISANIAPTFTDGQTNPISGTMCTEAPLVLPQSTGTQNLRSLSVAIADDFWNQLLAGMVESGKLRASFTKVLALGNYIPNCDEILPEAGDPLFSIKMRRYASCIGTTQCGPEDIETRPLLGEVCSVCADTFPFRTCGGTQDGQTCTLNNDCPGTCDGVCDGGFRDGEDCGVLGCGLGTCIRTCTGGPTPGAACTLNGDCRDECIGCVQSDDASCLQGACNRAARRAVDKKINADTSIALHARLDTPPAFYLVDDPNTPNVEMIFRTGEMRAALIANRDGNNDVGGFDLGDGSCGEDTMCDPENKCDQGQLDQLDLDTVPDCSLDSLATNADCLLWATCLDLNVRFAIGVQNVEVDGKMRPELDFELIGIEEVPSDANVEDQGDQCAGAFEIPDLDFLNTESLRNDARRGIERNFCEDTPPFQGCALDFDGTVEFINPALTTVSNCTDTSVCDTDFADYLVITGDLRAEGLGIILGNQVCEALAEKITENTGSCDSGGDGGDEEKEKICE